MGSHGCLDFLVGNVSSIYAKLGPSSLIMFLISYCMALLNPDVVLVLKEKYKTIHFNIYILFYLKYTGDMLWECAHK